MSHQQEDLNHHQHQYHTDIPHDQHQNDIQQNEIIHYSDQNDGKIDCEKLKIPSITTEFSGDALEMNAEKELAKVSAQMANDALHSAHSDVKNVNHFDVEIDALKTNGAPHYDEVSNHHDNLQKNSSTFEEANFEKIVANSTPRNSLSDLTYGNGAHHQKSLNGSEDTVEATLRKLSQHGANEIYNAPFSDKVEDKAENDACAVKLHDEEAEARPESELSELSSVHAHDNHDFETFDVGASNKHIDNDNENDNHHDNGQNENQHDNVHTIIDHFEHVKDDEFKHDDIDNDNEKEIHDLLNENSKLNNSQVENEIGKYNSGEVENEKTHIDEILNKESATQFGQQNENYKSIGNDNEIEKEIFVLVEPIVDCFVAPEILAETQDEIQPVEEKPELPAEVEVPSPELHFEHPPTEVQSVENTSCIVKSDVQSNEHSNKVHSEVHHPIEAEDHSVDFSSEVKYEVHSEIPDVDKSIKNHSESIEDFPTTEAQSNVQSEIHSENNIENVQPENESHSNQIHSNDCPADIHSEDHLNKVHSSEIDNTQEEGIRLDLVKEVISQAFDEIEDSKPKESASDKVVPEARIDEVQPKKPENVEVENIEHQETDEADEDEKLSQTEHQKSETHENVDAYEITDRPEVLPPAVDQQPKEGVKTPEPIPQVYANVEDIPSEVFPIPQHQQQEQQQHSVDTTSEDDYQQNENNVIKAGKVNDDVPFVIEKIEQNYYDNTSFDDAEKNVESSSHYIESVQHVTENDNNNESKNNDDTHTNYDRESNLLSFQASNDNDHANDYHDNSTRSHSEEEKDDEEETHQHAHQLQQQEPTAAHGNTDKIEEKQPEESAAVDTEITVEQPDEAALQPQEAENLEERQYPGAHLLSLHVDEDPENVIEFQHSQPNQLSADAAENQTAAEEQPLIQVESPTAVESEKLMASNETEKKEESSATAIDTNENKLAAEVLLAEQQKSKENEYENSTAVKEEFTQKIVPQNETALEQPQLQPQITVYTASADAATEQQPQSEILQQKSYEEPTAEKSEMLDAAAEPAAAVTQQQPLNVTELVINSSESHVQQNNNESSTEVRQKLDASETLASPTAQPEPQQPQTEAPSPAEATPQDEKKKNGGVRKRCAII